MTPHVPSNEPLSNSRHRNFTDVLRHLIASLHGRAPGDSRVPALHVRIGVEIDSLPFVARDPWPDGDVGDGVVDWARAAMPGMLQVTTA